MSLVDGLRALYSYTSDPIEALYAAGNNQICGVEVCEVSRNLSAIGLINLSIKISKKFSLNIFKSSLLPYLELLLKCEVDDRYLPPCRWQADDQEDKGSVMFCPVKPSMAFPRSDSSGPIGSGGNQLRAMYMTLEKILVEKKISNMVIMDVVEFLCFNSRTRKGNAGRGIPAFLITLAESRGMWLDLLRMYMRTENFVEAVRLVEVHVKYWKPRIGEDDPSSLSHMRLDIPLLVQLQRAVEIVSQEIDGGDLLLDKLTSSLEELKMTLRMIGDRIM
jgi:hypothetical protein